MPSQVEPRAHRNREPLMRIEGDRIGLFDTLQQMAQIRNKRSRAAPGGVSMQPEPLMSGHLCDALNRVNHTGVCSAPSTGTCRTASLPKPQAGAALMKEWWVWVET